MIQIPTSKNIVAAHIDANGNVIVGDGNNITVINLKEAAQYKALEAEIEKLNTRFERNKKRLEKYPNDSDCQEELLEIDTDRSQKQKDLETLKTEVLKLADDFQRIPINTERLRKAKEHFEKGEFIQARVVLDAEEIDKELYNLEIQEKKHEATLKDIKRHKADKANEYLILARLSITASRHNETIHFFEMSLRANRNEGNLFAFAEYLYDRNQLTQARLLYEETLQIYRKLVVLNPNIYLSYIPIILDRLGTIIQVIGGETIQVKPLYEEALQVYRQLAETNPNSYLPNLAKMQNTLANFYSYGNECSQAQPLYEEALEINIRLAMADSQSYLPDVAMTLMNLAWFYLQQIPEKEKSIAYCYQAVVLTRNFRSVGLSLKLLDNAKKLLDAWELKKELKEN